ncbi:MAG: hypothetical protein FJX40_14290 [Alphaproteobacteria bacterium]|nr:hypothetical protein [Alphaproteobacteria bacterium]MBM3642701.1 hypothetical protein [Alphaproteobacteria bacterium]
MAEGFKWFVSQDQERWHPAGDTTREGAIEFGRDEYGGESFHICEAVLEKITLRVSNWRLIELLELINEERVDPDGDGSIFKPEPTQDQLSDLETRVEAAIGEWMAAHSLRAVAWAFGAQRNEERIPDEREYPADIRARYHAIVAHMGAPKEARA